jgi:hypothetical protein
MQLEWLGQFGPSVCPPGTKRDLQSGFCFPDAAAAIEAASRPTVVVAKPEPTPDEKRNRMFLIAGGVVALGLLAYAVLK